MITRHELAKALRSDRWRRFRSQLGDDGGNFRCCLGVGCELVLDRSLTPDEQMAAFPADIGVTLFTDDVVVETWVSHHLSYLNDGSMGWDAVLVLLDDEDLWALAQRVDHLDDCRVCEGVRLDVEAV